MRLALPRAVLVILLCIAAGCAAPPQSTRRGNSVQAIPAVAASPRKAAPAPAPVQASYLIGTDDELEIRFPGHSELDVAGARVPPDGRLPLQWIGAVQVMGRSAEELEAEIAARYRQITPMARPNSEKHYLIAVNDEIEVKFANQPSLNEVVKVRPDGKISLNWVKTVEAEGKTPEQLESDLIERYRAFLRRPELVVIMRTFTATRVDVNGTTLRRGFEDLHPMVAVKSHSLLQVYVGGEVARPGVFNYRSPLTALQLIIEAGGQRPTGEMRSVIIIRKAAGEEPLLLRRDLQADRVSGDTSDIYLRPYDVVIVPKTGIAKTAELIDQYVWQVLPPLRNTSFGFIYSLHNQSTTTVRTLP